MAEIKIAADSGGGTVALKGPSATTGNANIAFSLPVADGSANQVLKTDGSKNFGWTSAIDSTHQGVCQAWCSYNGSTNSVRGSENISSVTDNGTGDFTFNFSSDFANTNYAVASSAIGSSNGDNMAVSSVAGVSSDYKQVGDVRVQCRFSGSTSNALTDITDVNIVVFH